MRDRSQYTVGMRQGETRRIGNVWHLISCMLALAAISEAKTTHLTEEMGARLKERLDGIARYSLSGSTELRLTELKEEEINAFLRFQGARHLPLGIADPVVRLKSRESIQVDAVIDLDGLKDSRQYHFLDPLQFLRGQLAVSIGGRLRSGNGQAKLDPEIFQIAGIQVPIRILNEIVHYFAGTLQQPLTPWLETSIQLPYNILEIRLSQGLAVVVQ